MPPFCSCWMYWLAERQTGSESAPVPKMCLQLAEFGPGTFLLFATNRVEPSGLTAIACGYQPVGISP